MIEQYGSDLDPYSRSYLVGQCLVVVVACVLVDMIYLNYGTEYSLREK